MLRPDAVVRVVEGNKVELEFDGVKYLPTDSRDGLGVLLYVLNPASTRCEGSEVDVGWLGMFLFLSSHFTFAAFVNNVKNQQMFGPCRDGANSVRNWITAALAMCPSDQREGVEMKLNELFGGEVCAKQV